MVGESGRSFHSLNVSDDGTFDCENQSYLNAQI
jgi:hypothetical protein